MPQKLTVYQKPTCITCKKALAFLDENKIPYENKDIIKAPPPRELLEATLDEKNLKASLNQRSTIYKEKNLGKANLSKTELITLMQQDPNLIKRPLIINSGSKTAYQGFDPDTLKSYLKN